ncbi:hypothetical protein [Niveibacterium sp.]|uniref:hypothetical protein n=1 Tax=Niveibacterium sp. TaxID=2017444 RepID=UPI0035B05F76
MKAKGSGGFALPILLILLSALAVFVAVKTLRTFGSFDLRASIRTDKALQLARDALIAHAAWEDSSPGSLLCPDLDNDGFADGSCAPNAIGRLPWRTLGISPPLDGSGECLWYALSPGARSQLPPSWRGASRSQPALNPDYTGELNLRDSTTGQSQQVVAVIIAPGRALSGQSRTSTGTGCNGGSANAFLESRDGINNASGGPSFVTGNPDNTFNDRSMGLTSDKLFAAAKARVLIELAGRDVPAKTGLRFLFGPSSIPSMSPGEFQDPLSAHLKMDFLNPTIRHAFPAPDTPRPSATTVNPAIEVQDIDGCAHYIVTRDKLGSDGLPIIGPGGTPEREVVGSAAGNYSIEWLCFNGWLDYTQYAPIDPDSARLALPGWQAEFSVASPPRLVRTPTP